MCYLLAINIIAFVACFIDKRAARRSKRRISEQTLFLLSAFGGAFGFLVGMFVFRHKTKHLSFRIMIPLFCAIWIVGTALVVKYCL
ncbi:MAG: DUF1294 domain-containing protein [Christensenella sp.]|uniref:DUF1294 domain-containing protein n=1 Tax=Christensenella sp. TaxID=1935934 RepID=UPI002B20487E|nr:DUF1294 domain-containing protein [Christensenella sp.]MEA5002235.1 DUF1294 domain-containing protein [Christensenella sp.]